jgi:hypothetical protein
MSRDGQRQMRQRIAQLAASLMVEHGIKDHAFAKRKAARQLGVEAGNLLPGNDEIDLEVRAYLALFQPDDHVADLTELRRQAVDVMELLARFQPSLTGAVVQGTASRHSDIELDVYADSSKEFEQFLLNNNIEFKGEERRTGSYFIIYSEPADVMVHVLPEQALQSAPRGAADTRKRLTLEQLRNILSESPERQVAEGRAREA